MKPEIKKENAVQEQLTFQQLLVLVKQLKQLAEILLFINKKLSL